ncbi:unnamed protein product, partial [Laminaria digitata]
RLFLVCAHTHQLVPCGHNGRGYDVQSFRQWFRVALDVAKFGLQATFSTLGVMIAALPTTTVGALGEEAFRAALSRIQGRLEGLVIDGHDEGALEGVQVQALKGSAYKCLRTFVHEMEDTARSQKNTVRKKARRKGIAPPSDPEFVFFEEVMSKVQ